MMGFFGGSKPASKKTADSPTQPPPTEAPPAPDAGGDDLFGGLAVTKPRRARKGKGDAEAVPVADKVAEPEPPVAAVSGGGLSRSKKKAAVAAAIAYKGSEAPEIALQRARLVRFYQEYRPEKLADVDVALSRYKGKEVEMFKALEEKYGPEPTGTLDLPEGHPYLIDHPEVAPVRAPESDGGADGGWGNDAAPEDDGSGWGGGGGDDWGSPAAESGFATEGFATEGVGFEAGGGGGWGDTAAESNQGFETAAFDAAPTAFDAAPAALVDSQKPEANVVSSHKVTPQHSDYEDETLNERHLRELASAKRKLGDSEERLSNLLRGVGESITSRRAALEEFDAMNLRVDELVHNERFEEAEELNAKLPALAESILQKDRATSKTLVTGKDAHNELLDNIKILADVYRSQEDELYRNQREEERRTTNYLMETTSRIEQLSEKVRADLDRATRALSHSEQEVQNLQIRQQKTQTKIEEQTKSLRTQREKNEAVRSSLASEIKDLEAKLLMKRKKLSEADAELSSIDEKMSIIKDEYSATLHDVGRMIDEERAKMEGHKQDVESLGIQEKQVQEEEANFSEEKRSMTFQMQTYSSRIQCYKTLADDLTNRQVDTISRFYEGTIRKAFHSRGKGTNFLVPVSQVLLDNAKDASQNGDHESLSSGSSAQSGGGINSGVDALKRKEHDLLNARSTISTMDAQIAATLLSIQNIDSQLPLLDAAKKAAAQSKQFKEAKAKAEEIATMTKSREDQEASLTEMRDRKVEAESDVLVLEREVIDEKRAAKERVAHFAESYAEILAECQMAADTPLLITAIVHLDESQAVAHYVESKELTNSSMTSADNTQPRPLSAKDVEELYRAGQQEGVECAFVVASKACLASLEDELLAVYPEASSVIASIRKSLDANPQPLPPVQDEEAVREVEEAAPISRTQSDVAPPNSDEWGAEPAAAGDWGAPAEGVAEWGAAEEEGFGGGGFEDVPTQVEEFDMESSRMKLSELEKQLEDAMAEDDFDSCERLQTEIDELERKIAANS